MKASRIFRDRCGLPRTGMIYTLLSEMHAQDKRFEATLLRSSWKMDRFENKMILYRPVGLQEMALIYDSGMKAFPARLPQQPIFYPVLQLEYARQTASDWNAQNGQFAGYVTQFKVEDEYISTFEEHAVGESQHQELWIQAEEEEEENQPRILF